jgi:hypothetical protein
MTFAKKLTGSITSGASFLKIEGMEITNPSGNNAILLTAGQFRFIEYNYIHDIFKSGTCTDRIMLAASSTRVTAVAHLEEIDSKIVALTGDYSKGKSGGKAGYNMSPLGKQIIILAANVRGLKHRVANGQASKAELVAAQKDLKELKAKASVEKKIARNKRLRDLRAAKRKTSY